MPGLGSRNGLNMLLIRYYISPFPALTNLCLNENGCQAFPDSYFILRSTVCSILELPGVFILIKGSKSQKYPGGKTNTWSWIST